LIIQKIILFLIVIISSIYFIINDDDSEESNINEKNITNEHNITLHNDLNNTPSINKKRQYNKPMEFYIGTAGGPYESYWIVAIGEIEKNTTEKFKKFMQKESPEGNKIVLHSPGGNLIGGIELGKEIRKYKLDTYIGNSINNPNEYQSSFNPIYNDFEKGKCVSSCAYAFLGGVDRYLIDKNFGDFYHGMIGSELGFHKFYNNEKIDNPNKAIENTQYASGILVSYMIDMGIDPKFMTFINSKKNNDIFYPNNSTLEKYNIINDKNFDNWKMVPYLDGMYAYSLKKGDIYPYNWLKQLGIFRQYKSNKIFLVLSDLDNLEVLTIQKEKIFDFSLIITIDNQDYTIEADKVFQIENKQDKMIIYVELDDDILKRILNTNSFSVSLDIPRVLGGCYGEVHMTPKEISMIKLTLKNSI